MHKLESRQLTSSMINRIILTQMKVKKTWELWVNSDSTVQDTLPVSNPHLTNSPSPSLTPPSMMV